LINSQQRQAGYRLLRSGLEALGPHTLAGRVAGARNWLEHFLASGEEIWGMSRFEREQEFAGNSHFSEGLISPETVERLGKTGIPVDPHNLEELASLVDSLRSPRRTRCCSG